ncbi:ESF1 homolog [Perca fluviatilis]|nr:ESF1 homolog [Perca fluviatilis]
MFTSHLFSLDPSHPSYKKTSATQSIQAEKQRRRADEQRRRAEDALTLAAGKKRENDPEPPTAEGAAKKPLDPGLSLLIKSVKSKTEQFQARKKQRVT